MFLLQYEVEEEVSPTGCVGASAVLRPRMQEVLLMI